MKTYDALILGGGCSGLSLAMAAASSPRSLGRIAILEPRSAYQDDRTWCFWNVHPHPHEELIRHRWKHWQVATPVGSTTSSASAYHYCQIRSGDFYDKARRTLESSNNCDLIQGITVHSLQQSGTDWKILTNAGDFLAPLVFDGRPPGNMARTQTGFWQHFRGWRVESEKACFEPDVATLMDFRPAAQEGIHFIYILPETRRTALVESTFFSPSAFEPEIYEDILHAHLKQMTADTGYRVVSRESGIIPMTPEFHPKISRRGLVEIGSRAGCIKPSSGYGFLNIQRHTRAIMRQWETGGPLVSPSARPRWLTVLDQIFLKWLRAHPREAPQMFFDLFRRVPPDSLVRFLSEQPAFSDALKVMWAMPHREFLATAICDRFSQSSR